MFSSLIEEIPSNNAEIFCQSSDKSLTKMRFFWRYDMLPPKLKKSHMKFFFFFVNIRIKPQIFKIFCEDMLKALNILYMFKKKIAASF